jgi:hypothetical protein
MLCSTGFLFRLPGIEGAPRELLGVGSWSGMPEGSSQPRTVHERRHAPIVFASAKSTIRLLAAELCDNVAIQAGPAGC